MISHVRIVPFNGDNYLAFQSLPPAVGPFHQHVYMPFLLTQIPKAQKDSQLKPLFALSGSAGVKAAHEHVDEIDPRSVTKHFFPNDTVLFSHRQNKIESLFDTFCRHAFSSNNLRQIVILNTFFSILL